MQLCDIIGYFTGRENKRKRTIINKIKEIKTEFYNIYTGFPPKMWKSPGTSLLSKGCVLLLSLFLLCSCASFKSAKGKEPPVLENALISMSEEDVRKKLGEPTVVSLTLENRIHWTYRAEWKIVPDNKDTVYIEFQDGKVVKVLKAKK